MPEMNGFQFAKWLRNFEREMIDKEYSSFLVACSANVSNKDIELYKEYGFDTFIEKPVDISKIDQVLDLHN